MISKQFGLVSHKFLKRIMDFISRQFCGNQWKYCRNESDPAFS